MNQYLVTAFDYKDEGAAGRRMNTRPAHLEMMRQLKRTDNYILGGAILDDAGNMIGSSILLQFDNDLQVSAWLAIEPYMLEKVWEKVDFKPFRIAKLEP